MTDTPRMQPDPSPTRSEKLEAIAAVFGTDVAARLGALPDLAARGGAPDPDRLAWQTNRLIRHMRQRFDEALPQTAPAATTPRRATPAPFRRTAALPTLAAGEDLAQEHPAVIAHMLRAEAQDVRVAVLRALPGHLARDVMRRLRTS